MEATGASVVGSSVDWSSTFIKTWTVYVKSRYDKLNEVTRSSFYMYTWRKAAGACARARGIPTSSI